MTTTATPVTPEHLRLAFSRLARPHRPVTIDAMLADDLYGPALRGLAASLARAQRVAAQRLRSPAIDLKRLQANDRDDD